MFQEAAFSKRITEEAGVEVIGGADKYMAVCRRCYFSPNNVDKYKIGIIHGHMVREVGA